MSSLRRTSREHNTPTSYFVWLSFPLKVSLLAFNVTSLAVSCRELAGASLCGCSFKNDGVDCRNLSTFAHAFTQNQLLKVFRLGTFTSIPEHHSVSNNAHVFDWSNFPHPSENASTFGLNWSAKLTQAVCGRPCSKVLVAQVVGFLRDLHHYTIERALCLLQILPSRQLFQSMLHQEFPGGCRLRSVHFLLTSYLQPLMLVLRGRLQQVLETNWQVPRLLE